MGIAAKYNMRDDQASSSDVHAAAQGAVTTVDSNVTRLSTDNPFVWLFGIGAVTLGLIGFSAHARVGSVRGDFSAGKP